MHPRFSFPFGTGDDLLSRCHSLELSIQRIRGELSLSFEIHGSVRDPFRDDDADEAAGGLMEKSTAETDVLDMVERLVLAMAKGGRQ